MGGGGCYVIRRKGTYFCANSRPNTITLSHFRPAGSQYGGEGSGVGGMRDSVRFEF